MSDTSWRPHHNRWAVAMTVTLATFMEVLDTSIANVSLPHIAGNLSEGLDAATWVLTSYLVSNAVVLPISGWLATRIGRKRYYMGCVALFTTSSLLCGLAPNLPTLIVCRVLQGAGGGGLQPSEQAILADTFREEERGMAFAIYGMAVVLAPAIGPTLGGWITDTASWRWIFFINVPVGITSLLLSHRLVEDPPWARGRSKDPSGRFRGDWIGLGLIVIGLGALQYVLDKGERDDWFASPVIAVFAIVAVVCLVAMVIWEWRHPSPIVDLKLLKTRSFAVSFGMMFVLGVALFGVTVLLPQYVQTLMGYTAQQAGEILSPGGLVVILLLPLVGKLLSKGVDPRWLIGFGFLANTWALFHMTNLYPGIDFSTAMRFRIEQSVGLAFLFIPITTACYVGVPRERNNHVSSMINLARNMGGSVGISVVTTLLARRAQHHQTHLVSHLTRFDPALRQALAGLVHRLAAAGFSTVDATHRAWALLYAGVQREALALAYVDTMWVLGIVSACMVPLAVLLRRPKKGAAMMAH